MNSEAEFDEYAENYDAALAHSLSVSGEGKEFFAEQRIAWLKRHLPETLRKPKTVMDFGCGTGSSVPFLLDLLEAESVIGIDVSPRTQTIAKQTHNNNRVSFLLRDEHQPDEQIDLVFSNGTFHHILPGDRASAIDYIHRSLRPGGLFALWENNPWNPGTRYAMSRCTFDKDAIPISHLEARRLVQDRGFEILSTEFLFIFPRPLQWFRALEPLVCRLPIGAQYQVLCSKVR
jgi:SAM-dependent methyltransferase